MLGVCGAKDVNTFRNSAHYQLPNVSNITYEGLFNEYMFDTKTNKKNQDEKEYDEKDQLIVPTYCYSKTKKPKSLIKAQRLSAHNNETTMKGVDDDTFEYFMTVGLNENFDVNTFDRNNLNLIICVDHSGSMSMPFYKSSDDDASQRAKNKMQIANESIIALLSHLSNNDRIGIIKFIQYFTVIQELEFVKNVNMKKLKKKILAIEAGGDEDLGKVYKRSIEMFENVFDEKKSADKGDKDKKKHQYSNRIIFLTDANITAGDTNPNSLCGMMKKYSDRKENQICTTFVGVGQDFNTDFMDIVSKTNGGNYYSVHSSKAFMKTMDEEFIFMVSPLANAFKLTLLAEGNSCCIDAVFGSGDDEKAVLDDGEVMNVQSVFPSPHDEKDEIRGGVVLLQMKTDKKAKKGIAYNMETKVVYVGVDGKEYEINDSIQFGGASMDNINKAENDYFDNNGIRKSILLVRYVQLLKEWQKYGKKQMNKVSDEYKEIFREFKQYFLSEMKEIGDAKLERELKILNQFIQWK